jgi:5,10-methylene-tetrahydrofolate dehydrogenase/methenyl tetrahydrofolate cyclohydrolase
MSSSNTTILAAAALSAAVGAGVALTMSKFSSISSENNSSNTKVISNYDGPVGTLINGRDISKIVRAEIKKEVEDLVNTYQQRPGLGVIIVGDRKDSQTYVRMKKKAAGEVGIHSMVVEMLGASTQEQILNQVQVMNNDPLIHGILVQLPLPKGVDEEAVLSAIDISKDVDGFCAENIGNLALRGHAPLSIPCTPAGCVELLKRSNVEVRGKNCVVVGRSNIVGMPMAALLQAMDGTVTVCHSKTRDIQSIVREADIVVAAVGQPEFVKGSWLKPGCVVIDVGINSVDDASKKRGYRLVGDVEFNEAKQIASQITPVPGGVGPMTIAMLLKNTINLFVSSRKRCSCDRYSYLFVVVLILTLSSYTFTTEIQCWQFSKSFNKTNKYK